MKQKPIKVKELLEKYKDLPITEKSHKEVQKIIRAPKKKTK